MMDDVWFFIFLIYLQIIMIIESDFGTNERMPQYTANLYLNNVCLL